jgi:NRAMP (natural resistance-associated macrophage protein)-like metal ion transporter
MSKNENTTPVTPRGSQILRLWRLLGPGFITGASDDDPSGIGTYAIAGASFGFATLWTALVTLPMMAVVQFICAKVGMVAGEGLGSALRKNYSRKIVYPAVIALVVANMINAGADIGAIAAALNLFLPIPIGILILPITGLILAVQIWGSYRLIASIFKWLTLSLRAYIASAFFARPDFGAVLRGTFIPHFQIDSKFLSVLVAILGTTISPYLFFFQASQEVEEEIAMGRRRLWQRQGATDDELKIAALDVKLGMFFSNLIMYFIILATGARLFRAGQRDIQSATQAAEALRPVAGRFAEMLLAAGLIGAGMLAVPVLTGSSAYAFAEMAQWRRGLDEKPHRARNFYIFIAVSTFAGMLINFIGINPISALFWTAVLNGFVAPPLLLLSMPISNNPGVMGNRVNGRLINFIGWLTTLVMFAAAIGLIVTWK